MGNHSIGVISDTHGLLRVEAVQALQGSEQIIHAGDIGKPEILEQLAGIAPLTAVRGNIDRGDWSEGLPINAVIEVNGIGIYILHDILELDIDPRAAGFSVVISGHSHKPDVERRDGVLYLNPGSAGPRRFHLPVSLARIELDDSNVLAEIIDLS